MTAIISNLLRVSAARAFKEAISNINNNYYMFLGKGTPWNVEETPIEPQPNTSGLLSAYRDMIIAKKISGLNTSLCIPRYDWESNVVFDEYNSNDSFLFDNKKFYVLTDEMKVYKCISNNGGAESTVKPTATTDTVFSMIDGYKWKYMYTLTTAQMSSFLNSQFIPVNYGAETAGNNLLPSNPGSIEHVKILNGGNGYIQGSTVTFNGDGQGAVGKVIGNGVITGIEITNPGSGYTYATIEVPDGVGVEAEVQISPTNGHGSQPSDELGAYYIMISMLYDDYIKNRLPEVFSFRKIGIIENPNSSISGKFTEPVGYGTYTVNITTNTNLRVGDSILIEGVNEATVLGIEDLPDGTQTIIFSECDNIKVGDEFVKSDDALVSGIVNSVIKPSIDKLSYNTLFLDYRYPITMDVNQSQYVKFVIEF